MRTAVRLFVLTFLIASAVHLSNRYALRDAGVALRHGVTVITADDPAYLTPAERWLAGDGWRTYEPGTAAYVGRSPGYGMVYAFFRLWLPVGGAIGALFWLQIALYSLAVALLPGLSIKVGLGQRSALFLALTAAVLPIFSGFLSYTLTEGLVPSLVVIVLALLAGRNPKCVLAGAVALGFLLLIRPAMAIWLVALAWALWPLLLQKRWLWAIAAVIMALGPAFLWQWHGYQKADRWVGLHPIYHWDSNDLYRPTHQAVWGFHKAWGHRGYDFHRAIGGLWTAAQACTHAGEAVDEVLAAIPQPVAEAVHPDTLRSAYEAYYRVLQLQAPYHQQGVAMPVSPEAYELAVVSDFERLRHTYQRTHPIHAHVGVPLRVYFGDMAAHSNLSLYLFQKTLRGRWWMEALRWICTGFHLGLFLIFPIAFCCGFRQKWWWPVALPVAGYLIYLAAVQRGVEERYTLPVLIPMWLVGWAWLEGQWQKWVRQAP